MQPTSRLKGDRNFWALTILSQAMQKEPTLKKKKEMCTTISCLKKAYIQRWLNQEMISATCTILLGTTGTISSEVLGVYRNRPWLVWTRWYYVLLPPSHEARCRRQSGQMKRQIYRFYDFIISKPHLKRDLLIIHSLEVANQPRAPRSTKHCTHTMYRTHSLIYDSILLVTNLKTLEVNLMKVYLAFLTGK